MALQGTVDEVAYLYNLEVLRDNASCYWTLVVHKVGLHTYWEDILWGHQDDKDQRTEGVEIASYRHVGVSAFCHDHCENYPYLYC